MNQRKYVKAVVAAPKKRTPKKSATRLKPQPLAPNKLELFVKSIVEVYPSDATFPSIVVSWIPTKQEFYASIARYNETYGRAKSVIISAYALTLTAALSSCLEQWYAKINPSKAATEALIAARTRSF